MFGELLYSEGDMLGGLCDELSMKGKINMEKYEKVKPKFEAFIEHLKSIEKLDKHALCDFCSAIVYLSSYSVLCPEDENLQKVYLDIQGYIEMIDE